MYFLILTRLGSSCLIAGGIKIHLQVHVVVVFIYIKIWKDYLAHGNFEGGGGGGWSKVPKTSFMSRYLVRMFCPAFLEICSHAQLSSHSFVTDKDTHHNSIIHLVKGTLSQYFVWLKRCQGIVSKKGFRSFIAFLHNCRFLVFRKILRFLSANLVNILTHLLLRLIL
jgi:hypothetical protein